MKIQNIFRWFGKVALSGLLGLMFFILLDIAMWVFPPQRGWAPWNWKSAGPVAVGNNQSIEILTRNANMVLAEYDQRLLVYGGTPRVGKRLGTINLHMNTGGRTHILVYFLQSQNGDVVLLKDRFGSHHLNLSTLKLEEQYGSENNEKYKFIGTVSGEAHPLKFVPPSVWTEADALKKING